MRFEQLAAMRETYERGGLDVADLAPEPFTQFARWLDDAVAAGLPEPNAMVLATAAESGAPSARTVLLKGVEAGGFVLFTNYTSRKGRELAANPRASLLFPWHALARQVLVEGDVARLGVEASAAYFRTRPRASQLGAWASEQSAMIPSREVLEERYAALERRWPEGTQVPVPDFWGGLRVLPRSVEFWQGRPGRLHDRLCYRRAVAEPGAGGWVVERLSP